MIRLKIAKFYILFFIISSFSYLHALNITSFEDEEGSSYTEFTSNENDQIRYFLKTPINQEEFEIAKDKVENLELHPIEALQLWMHNYLKEQGGILYDAYLFFKKYINMDDDHLLLEIFGENNLMLLGFYSTEAESGKWGAGEVSNHVRVSFINGILTNTPALIQNLSALSEAHGDVNIHYVYRPSKGWTWDLMQSLFVQMGHTSIYAKRLSEKWQNMIEEMGGVDGGGKIIHYAHSIGTMETLRALELLSDEERKMIFVYAFGSPSLFTHVPEIQHYASVRDGVSILIDFPSFIKAYLNPDEGVYLSGTYLGIPFADHLFTSETYSTIWSAMGKTFVEKYGQVKKP